MVKSIYRPTKMIIDSSAILSNFEEAMRRKPAKTELFAVVKANAYGHGSIGVAKIAEKVGVAGFCVATVDEGIELREAGITLPILILNVVPQDALDMVLRYNLSITVASLAWLTTSLNHPDLENLRIHLKIDTGMNRIGFKTKEEFQAAVNFLENNDNYLFEGVFTHFATADEKDQILWEEQNTRFQEFLSLLPYLPRFVHSANTATYFWHKNFIGNMIRFGLGIYGLNPAGKNLPEIYPLKPAMKLVSKLSQVKKIHAKETVSYGATWQAEKDTYLGTIPIGYADGYLRKLQGFHVLIKGQFCKIVGRICMDQMMVELPQEFTQGTRVTLIGEDCGQKITVQDVADYLDTINYEVLCLFNERIPRIFR